MSAATSLFAALTAAQAGLQAQGGYAARAQGNANAARLQEMGGVEADRLRREGAALAGKQRAAFAKAGVDVFQGTPMDVLAQTVTDTERNAMLRALQFDQAASEEEQRGKLEFQRSLLGAAGTVASAIPTGLLIAGKI